MRVPLPISLALILLLALLIQRNHRHLEALRGSQERLAGQARAAGWIVDPRAPGGLVKPTRKPRPDRETQARELAAGLISYARELPFPADMPLAEQNRRIALESSRLEGLEGNQWRIVIGELQAALEADSFARRNFLRYALHRLSASHPREAFLLAIEMADPQHFSFDQVCSFLRIWATADALAAHAWLEENRADLPENRRQDLLSTLLQGALLGPDPALALVWQRQYQGAPSLRSLLPATEIPSAQRLILLRALNADWQSHDREHLALPDRIAFIGVLFFGPEKSSPAALRDAMTLWNEAGLGPAVSRELSQSDFTRRIDPAESVDWFQWFAREFPAEDAHRCQQALLRNPVTAAPLRSWLASQTEDLRQRWLPDLASPPQAPGGKPVSALIASPVPGKEGYVFSPYTHRVIDVRGLPSGTLVMDPETGGSFRLP